VIALDCRAAGVGRTVSQLYTVSMVQYC